MPIPAANIANWIKNGANAAAYNATGKVVTIEGQDVVSTSGTMIKDANYGDDIRDFLVATLDAVFKVYDAMSDADKTTAGPKFKVQRVLTGNQVQFIVSVQTNGDVDFPTFPS